MLSKILSVHKECNPDLHVLHVNVRSYACIQLVSRLRLHVRDICKHLCELAIERKSALVFVLPCITCNVYQLEQGTHWFLLLCASRDVLVHNVK